MYEKNDEPVAGVAVRARRPLEVYKLQLDLREVLEGFCSDTELLALIERNVAHCEFWWLNCLAEGIWLDSGEISWEPRLISGYFDPHYPESVRLFLLDQRIREIGSIAARVAKVGESS